MARAKKQGKRIGRPASEVANDPAVIALIATTRAKGNSYRLIAEALDAEGIPTPGGSKHWRPATVADIYNRYAATGGDAA